MNDDIVLTEEELKEMLKAMETSKGVLRQGLLNQALFELVRQQGGHVSLAYSQLCGPELVAGISVQFTSTGMKMSTVDKEIVCSLIESEGQEKH